MEFHLRFMVLLVTYDIAHCLQHQSKVGFLHALQKMIPIEHSHNT